MFLVLYILFNIYFFSKVKSFQFHMWSQSFFHHCTYVVFLNFTYLFSPVFMYKQVIFYFSKSLSTSKNFYNFHHIYKLLTEIYSIHSTVNVPPVIDVLGLGWQEKMVRKKCRVWISFWLFVSFQTDHK